MISGVHTIIYTKDADADRAFFKDVLGLKSVDAGGGWLIFKTPPAEAAFHPGNENNRHELYLMCDNIKEEIQQLSSKGVKCSDVHEEQWGFLVNITLPGGGELGIYQPKHPTAINL